MEVKKVLFWNSLNCTTTNGIDYPQAIQVKMFPHYNGNVPLVQEYRIENVSIKLKDKSSDRKNPVYIAVFLEGLIVAFGASSTCGDDLVGVSYVFSYKIRCGQRKARIVLTSIFHVPRIILLRATLQS